MGLETATNIGDLNPANPLPTDGPQNGDDHLRLIKQVLVHVLGSIDAPLTMSKAQLEGQEANAKNYAVQQDTTLLEAIKGSSGAVDSDRTLDALKAAVDNALSGNGSAQSAAQSYADSLVAALRADVQGTGSNNITNTTTALRSLIDNGLANIKGDGPSPLTHGGQRIDNATLKSLIDTAQSTAANAESNAKNHADSGDSALKRNIQGDGPAPVPNNLNALAAAIQAAKTSLYPVGSIYINASNSANPSTLLGFGSWSRVGHGRVLVGQGGGNDGATSRSFSAGEQGGEYKHTLTETEMPAHKHASNVWVRHGDQNGQSVNGVNYSKPASQYKNQWEHHKSHPSAEGVPDTSSVGGGAAHNNVQPYLTVYMWQRVS